MDPKEIITEQLQWETAKYKFELPIDGSSDSQFIQMGIEFGPFNRKDKWRPANFPKGWKINSEKTHILDDKDRPRAYINAKGHPHFRPICRFHFGQEGKHDDKVRFCVWDKAVPLGEKRKVVLDFEKNVPSRQKYQAAHEARIETYKQEFKKTANQWLDEKYPNWSQPSAHWDDEETGDTNEDD